MVMTAALVACGEAPTDRAPDDIGDVDATLLTSDEYTIVKMATAHGALTVEVEVDSAADTSSIARRLVEPVQNRYAEVLVYFYDRSADGPLPISRVQWTAERGYVTIDY